MKQPPPKKKRTAERWRALMVPMLLGVPTIAALVWLLVSTRPEAMTPKMILGKQEWTEQELTETLARAFTPQNHQRTRGQVLSHLRKQLAVYPQEKQREILIRSMTVAMGETLRQIRVMPPDERERMYQVIEKQAKKWAADSRRGKGKEMVGHIRNSEEGRAFNQEAARIVQSELTPEERRKFAPITMLWIETMRQQ